MKTILRLQTVFRATEQGRVARMFKTWSRG